MALDKESLLAKLSAGDVAFQLLEHRAVMTVEAQSEELTALGVTAVQGIVKNLFLKDKKARYYIISALGATKVDLKVLSARLGLGKGGIRMADSESLEHILQVPLGSVTPLAVANPEAQGVILLLDHKILSEPLVFLHPLVNTASLGMSPEALKAALKVFGCEAVFVDLEADPKIDRENPPDLAKYVPEAVAVAQESAQAASSAPAAASQPQPASSPAPSKQPAAKPAAAASKQPKPQTKDARDALDARHRELSDVMVRTDDILQKVAQTLIGSKLDEAKVSDPYALTRLRADVEMQLNALKNAAYASGYLAGKGEIVGFASKSFA